MPNIAAHLAEMARLQPSRPAVVCAHGRDGEGAVAYQQLSFRELEQASDRLALALAGAGIRRGMRTALMVPPSLDFFTLTFALFKTGAVPVLIDPGIGVRSLGGCLATALPEAFIGIPKAHAARVLLGWARGSVRINITVGTKWFWGGPTLEELRERIPAGQPFGACEPAPDECAAILFTSGSTGAPKGAVYTHEIFGAQVAHIRDLYGIEPGEMDLATFPLFALFGPALGMTAVVPEMDASRPAIADPAILVGAIRKFGVTNMFGSPALINRIGRHGTQHGIKLPTLRRAISAGAPVASKVLERFAALLPEGARVFTPYGATECLPVASIGSDEILGETRHATDRGAGVCIGRPVPGLKARIIRITDEAIAQWGDAQELPAGEIGEIAVQAAHATRTYFNLPQATALAKIQAPPGGGFYHRMGDVGYFDAAGRLWFCGRKAHRVVTPHGTLFTEPCEGVFNTHPRVFRTALVGVQRNGVMEPVLCVELEPAARGDSKEEIRSALRELGARNERTRQIETILFHPAFPVDVRHNAKIFRDRLALWAGRQLGVKALVTGGGGFLGQAIVRGLRRRGASVRSFSRHAHRSLDALDVEQLAGDVADPAAVSSAVQDCEIVFHVAAKPGIWGAYEEYREPNVTGTQNVIAACRRHGVRRLVYTSSPSVVFDGRDMEGADESAPYPTRFEAHYPRTKAQAEQLVRAANDAQLATVSLRPHLIWGPGDNHLLPRLVARARKGQLARIGSRPNMIDTVYVDNAAEAHLLAAERLAPGSPIAGKVYFISQGEPVPMWEMVNRLLDAAGAPLVTRAIPTSLALALAWGFETAHRLTGNPREPRLTRFVVHELSTAHWFDISAARRDFGYAPAISIADGLEMLRKSLGNS